MLVPVAIRAELRRLKAEFDAAFSRLRRDAGPDDADYREARHAYGLWRIAIDQYGVALIDDLDSKESGAAGLRAPGLRSPILPLTPAQQVELRDMFQEIDRMDEMRRLIEDA